MTKDEDFKLLKIQTCVLKVHIHCDGCKQTVKKLLQRIEGVYTVNIEAEQQKVTVSGSVDSATLIKKLVKSGKHAELWSQKSNQNQKQKQPNCIKDGKNSKDQKQGMNNGLKAIKNQQKIPTFNSEDDDDECDEDDLFDDTEEELRLLREKASRMGLLWQTMDEANNSKKNGAIPSNVPANNVNINNGGNGNVGKKNGGNPNQNMGMRAPIGGIDQKAMGGAQMKNHMVNGGNSNAGEVKRMNDLNAMMGLAGMHGHGAGHGHGGNGLGFQVPPNTGFQGSSAGFPNGGFPPGGNQHHLHPPSSMMTNMNPSPLINMNMQNRQNMNNVMMNESRFMQPQMMYHRSPIIPPQTGYYYGYNPSPYPGNYPEYNNSSDYSESHMFNDENTNSCVIM